MSRRASPAVMRAGIERYRNEARRGHTRPCSCGASLDGDPITSISTVDGLTLHCAWCEPFEPTACIPLAAVAP